MFLRVPSLVVASALLLLGCGASGGEGAGAGNVGGAAGGGSSGGASSGGGGTETITTSTLTGGTGGATGGAGGTTSSGGAGGAATCDSLATCGNTGEGCVACAIGGACAAAYDGCFGNDQCVAYQQCIHDCLEDAACLAACEQASPDGKAPYDVFFQCVLCEQCPISCAPASCPP